jgi:anti-sigma B factor antagonist
MQRIYPRTTVGGRAVVTAPAQIDITVAEQLRTALLTAERDEPTVVVDMTRTQFCDSAGLNVLVRAHKRAVAEGGELRLAVAPAGTVARVLSLTCLDRVIPCFSSLAEALGGPAAGHAEDQVVTAR